MANSKLTKSLSFALFAIIFSLSIILGAAAQNIYVITYGASEAPQETSQQESIEITTSSDNVLINKYSPITCSHLELQRKAQKYAYALICTIKYS
jgi:hypothetical protein